MMARDSRRVGSIWLLAGLSLLKGCMGRDQLPHDFDALVRNRDEFPPALRRSNWFDEHKRKQSRRDFAIEHDGPFVRVVISSRT